MDDELTNIDLARLTRIVRAALGEPDAEVTRWTHERIGWSAINPSTAGLYRLSGAARTAAARDVPWQVVLKMVADVDFTGHPLDRDYMHQPGDWNYWQREALAFESGLLTGWSGPLVAVRALGVDHVTRSQAWIWLEAIADAPSLEASSAAASVEAARHLGTFAAQWSHHVPSVADHAWLAEHWPRGWLRSIRSIGLDHALTHNGCWEHPLLAPIAPPSAQGRLQTFMAEAELLLDILDSLPNTLAHHDPQLSNLFRTAPGRTTAIDWSFCGLAPIGVDLGLFVGGNLSALATDATEAIEFDRAATAAYLQGLREGSWSGDETAVVFARAVAAAVVVGSWYGLQVSLLCADHTVELGDAARRWPYDLAAQRRTSVESALQTWSAAFNHLLDLAEAARALAGRLSPGSG